MTRLGVRRTRRTASRPACVPPTGDRQLLPPTSQAVEKRPSHRHRAALRIGVRALLVGGFAGAAWLLTAGGAQAAPADTPTTDAVGDLSVVTLDYGSGSGAVESDDARQCSPVTDPVGNGYVPAVPSTVGELLAPVARATAVVLPCTTAAQGTPVPDLLPADQPGATTDRGAAATTARTADAAVTAAAAGGGFPDRADTAANRSDGLLDAVPGTVAPLGRTDAPAVPTGLLAPLTGAVAPLDAVLRPATDVLRPATDVLRRATAPVVATVGPALRAVTGGSTRPAGGQAGTPDPSPVPGGVAGRAAVGGPDRAAAAARTGDGAFSSTTSVNRSGGTEPRAAARTGSHLPDPTDPAPLRAHLGTGPGTPANGPGCHSDGGVCTVVPSSVVGGMVAFHRLPVTTDVVVRPHDAEAPTVSPD